MKFLLGGYEFEDFETAKLNQRAASAWSAVGIKDGEKLVGTEFKPLLYCGKQIVRGINHLFIAEETITSLRQDKRIVAIVVNEFNGEFEVVTDKFKVIFG